MAKEKGLHDEAIDILKERLFDAADIVKERYKGVRTFRQEPISDKERILLYDRMLQNPQVLQAFEQEVGADDAIAYHQQMGDLIRRQQK